MIDGTSHDARLTSCTLTVNEGAGQTRRISQWNESSRGKLSAPFTVSKLRSCDDGGRGVSTKKGAFFGNQKTRNHQSVSQFVSLRFVSFCLFALKKSKLSRFLLATPACSNRIKSRLVVMQQAKQLTMFRWGCAQRSTNTPPHTRPEMTDRYRAWKRLYSRAIACLRQFLATYASYAQQRAPRKYPNW